MKDLLGKSRRVVRISIPVDRDLIGQWLTCQGFVADILVRQRKASALSQFERERLSKVERERLFQFIELLSASLFKETIESVGPPINESVNTNKPLLDLFQEHNPPVLNKDK